MPKTRTAACRPKKQSSDDEEIEETKSSKRGSTKLVTMIVENEIIEDKIAKTKAKKSSRTRKPVNYNLDEILGKDEAISNSKKAKKPIVVHFIICIIYINIYIIVCIIVLIISTVYT
jgi:hypothetical protein